MKYHILFVCISSCTGTDAGTPTGVAGHQAIATVATVTATPQVMYNAQVMQDMLAPMGAVEFFQDYYLKEPVHIRRANAVPPLFQMLLTFAELDALLLLHGRAPITKGAFSLMSNNGSVVPVLPAPEPGDAAAAGRAAAAGGGGGGSGGGDGAGAGAGEYTRRLLEDGNTLKLSLESINPEHLPAGARAAFDGINMMLGGANISSASRLLWDGDASLEESEFRSSIHIYATGPQAGARGLNPHTDPYDVFILQLEGSKQWTVCTPPPLPHSRKATAAPPTADAPPFATRSAPAPPSPSPSPSPSFLSSVVTVPAQSSAEKAELHLQAQHKSDQCTFYTDKSLAELDCTQFVMEAGDTYYMPKGLVHFATSTGALSMHATISLVRKQSTWFDLVLDELVQTDAAAAAAAAADADESVLRWDADVLEQLVQSTPLGVRLAQLVPLGAATLLPSHGGNASSSSRSSTDLEQHLDAYLDALVALTRSSRQGTNGAKQHVLDMANHARWTAYAPLQWLQNVVAARAPFSSTASTSAHGRLQIAQRIARLKKGAAASSGVTSEARRKRRGNTRDGGTRWCDDSCDDSCFLGFSCDSSCDGSCSCTAGHGPKTGGRCPSCQSTQYKTGTHDGACTSRSGCSAGSYWKGANTKAKGACTPCLSGQYSSIDDVFACKPCVSLQCNDEQYQLGSCGGSANDQQCRSCQNAVCAQGQYRAGTCGADGKGFACTKCDHLQCTGEHEYRAGNCGGGSTPTANAYTCDTHEPCPQDTQYIPSDTTHRTCPPCPDGQHQPSAAHRERNCIDTTTTTSVTTSSTTTTTYTTSSTTTTTYTTSTTKTYTTTTTTATATVTTTTLNARQLLDNGTTIEELVDAGMQVHELVDRGFTLLELVQAPGANITIKSLEDAEVSADDINALKTTLARAGGQKKTRTGVVVAVLSLVLLAAVCGMVLKRSRRENNAIPHLGALHAAAHNQAFEAELMPDASYKPAFEPSVEQEAGQHPRDTIQGIFSSVHGISRDRVASVTVSSSNNALYTVPMEMEDGDAQEAGSSNGASVTVSSGNNARYVVPMEMTEGEEREWGASSSGADNGDQDYAEIDDNNGEQDYAEVDDVSGESGEEDEGGEDRPTTADILDRCAKCSGSAYSTLTVTYPSTVGMFASAFPIVFAPKLEDVDDTVASSDGKFGLIVGKGNPIMSVGAGGLAEGADVIVISGDNTLFAVPTEVPGVSDGSVGGKETQTSHMMPDYGGGANGGYLMVGGADDADGAGGPTVMQPNNAVAEDRQTVNANTGATNGGQDYAEIDDNTEVQDYAKVDAVSDESGGKGGSPAPHAAADPTFVLDAGGYIADTDICGGVGDEGGSALVYAVPYFAAPADGTAVDESISSAV